LMTVKAGGDETGGAFTLIDCWCPAGFGPPTHRHEAEDEAFYVLDGGATVRCGDDEWQVGPGDFVMLPRGVPHDFHVGQAGPLHILQITSPAQFERFAAELGVPATSPTLPPHPFIPDPQTMAAVHERYHIALLGPPPHAGGVG
jgi:mannose-6-phosphate isomerase-like protein (cupin superfamily)